MSEAVAFTSVERCLQQLTPGGWLEIVSTVDGVEIEINGAHVGVTPLKEPLAVTPGDLVVVARRPGFTELQKELHVGPFERIKFQLELGKAEPAKPPQDVR